MSYPNYLIKNCSAKNSDSACPKLWDRLKPAFSDMVRHCDHCNKKVYLCETDEQIKFYTSVKFCIAVGQPRELPNVEENPPLSVPLISNSVEPTAQHDIEIKGGIIRSIPNVWRRPSSPVPHEGDARAYSLQMQRITDDSDIPAFLRKKLNS